MSQLEQQYDELEEVGRELEQALRDAGEDSKSNRTTAEPPEVEAQ